MDSFEHIVPEHRVRRLRAWLAWNGMTYADLARCLGVSRQLICQIARANKAPAHRIQQLVELGVPREYLPEANAKKGSESSVSPDDAPGSTE